MDILTKIKSGISSLFEKDDVVELDILEENLELSLTKLNTLKENMSLLIAIKDRDNKTKLEDGYAKSILPNMIKRLGFKADKYSEFEVFMSTMITYLIKDVTD